MTHLKEGDFAPEIKGIDQFGKTISWEDYKGKKVVLYFYPKDNTPGCTAESCDLSDNYSVFLKKGYDIVGVSADSVKKHLKFVEKYKLPFRLIADEEKEVIQAYGIWGPKKFMGREFDGIHRTTFLIDEDRKIEAIFTKVKTKEHAKQLFEVIV